MQGFTPMSAPLERCYYESYVAVFSRTNGIDIFFSLNLSTSLTVKLMYILNEPISTTPCHCGVANIANKYARIDTNKTISDKTKALIPTHHFGSLMLESQTFT